MSHPRPGPDSRGSKLRHRRCKKKTKAKTTQSSASGNYNVWDEKVYWMGLMADSLLQKKRLVTLES